jgi:hypothetical protein
MFRMKKAVLIGLAAVLFVGGGTALAVNTPQNFEDMPPFTQERQPHMIEEEIGNYFGENGMHRGPYWDEENGRQGMHRDPYWEEENGRQGMHRDPYWDEENGRQGMHRDPYWDEENERQGMHRDPHWNEKDERQGIHRGPYWDEEGNGTLKRGEYPGYGKDRNNMKRSGAGMDAEYEESK